MLVRMSGTPNAATPEAAAELLSVREVAVPVEVSSPEKDTVQTTQGPSLHPPTRRPSLRRARLRKRAGSVAMGTIVVLSVAALLAVALAQEPPGWFRHVDAKDQRVIDSARRIENALTTMMTRLRQTGTVGASGQTSKVSAPGSSSASASGSGTPPGDTWTIAITADDATAWLNARLPKWLENQEGGSFTWPEEVGTLRLDFDAGRIYAAASLHKGGQVQVFSASVEPQLRDDGSLWMPAKWLGVGRLPLPTRMVLGQGGATTPRQLPAEFSKLPQSRDVLSALRGEGPAMQTPIVKIGDGRRVQLLAIEPHDGQLLITLRSLPVDQPRRASRE
jgi:hypothetical protein